MKILRNGCVIFSVASILMSAPVFAEQAPVYDADSSNAAIDNSNSVDADLPPPPSPEASNITRSMNRSAPSRSSEANASINERLNRIEEQLNTSQSVAPNSRIDNLQTEIQSLRGQVEQLSHELKQIQTELRSQSDDMQQRISKLENNKSDNKIRPEKLEKQKNKKTDDDVTVPSSDDVSNQVDVPDDDNATSNKTLDPAAKLNQDNEKKINKKIAVNKKTIVAVTEKKPEAAAALNANHTESELASDENINEEQTLYQSAYGFIKEKKYPQAVAALQKMLNKYPSGQFAANAHYWLGELYGLMNKPIDAEREFNQVIVHYGKNPRVPDAMLKVGLIYASEMKWIEAKAMFRKIVSKYPNTSSAKLAQQQLKEIKKLGN